MSHPVYYVPAGDVLPIYFTTYAGSTGASITMTGLAVTDIEIYKDASMTQRASDAGYTLIDTDGIDIDGTTGVHGFTIDTGDNTDASFYTVGAWFTVVVSAVTVDTQTVNFIAAQFRIMAAEGVAGVPDVNTTHISDTAQTAKDVGGAVPAVAAGASGGLLISGSNSGTTTLAALTVTGATTMTGGLAGAITGNITGNLSGSVGSVTASVNVGQLAGQTVTAAAGVTFPTSVASPTNITAGTITTVTNLTNAATSGDFTSTQKASINTEVLDVLNTDTFAEPAQGAPGTTVTLAAKIGYLYKAWRNKSTQTSSTYSLYNDDAATVDHKSTVSDDGTTFTRGEVATGP
jgi:hypothetical protein